MGLAKLLVYKSQPLDGDVTASGAKNAALPILAATILSKRPLLLSNIPHLQDITTMINLLGQLGSSVTIDANVNVEINNANLNSSVAPYDLVRTMRASILVLGPLLVRFGQAKVSLPGGCAIGSRPVDLHLKGLEAMGASVKIDNGFIDVKTNGCLRGAKYKFAKVTVTGTENILMAATLAEGQTILENCACEPEVSDLANFLVSIGAKISGIGTSTLVIDGVKELTGGKYSVMSDRIEAGTYLAAGVATRGRVKVKSISAHFMTATLDVFKAMGAEVNLGDDWIEVNMRGRRPTAVSFKTAPYPGVATDMQAQLLVINALASGEATIVEDIFENRLMHVMELKRMGAKLNVNGNTVQCTGVENLHSAPVMATDLRASASLVIAGLVADGDEPTQINRIYHVDRGYELIEEKFSQLGAKVERVH
jgi:UDP-N-acetylglucosamine 1-carboxyvinyltransferase